MTRWFKEKKEKKPSKQVTLQVLRESYTTGVARKQLMINRYSSNFHMLIVSFFSLLLVFLHVANNYT